MATKFYNVPPYYDDFDPAKNYVRVLFRPGYAVQARELTQLQTAISAQIDRFGSHVFKEGSRVLGGEVSLDTKYAYVKLESTFTDSGTTYYPEGGSGNTAYYLGSVGRVLTGAVSGITATVLELTASTTEDSLTAFVRYDAASTNNLNHLFTPEEILNYTESSGVARKFKVKGSSVNPVGFGSNVSVTEGVWFVSGNFVYTEAESIIVSKYTQNPSVRVVYRVTESIVTPAEDASLVDNSLGTPNESAPGAHRYQIGMELVSEPYALGSRTEENIIQVLLVIGGQISARARTEYSELAKEFATRTYEESGNYTVRPFQINVREYYNSGTNNGLYTASQILAAIPSLGTSNAAIAYGQERLAVGLSPSVAYVSGYRVETTDMTYVPVRKSREEGYINNAGIFAPLGGYCYINTVVGMPNITTYSTINLKNSGSTIIGTARARSMEFVSGTTYKLYLFDVSMNSGQSFASVATLQDTSVPGTAFTATIDDIDPTITTSELYDPSNSSLLYRLPVSAVQSLRESDNVSTAFIYQVRRKFDNVQANASGQITLTASSENFYSVSQSDYIIVKANGTVVSQTASPVLSSPNTTSVTLYTDATANANAFFYVIAPTRRNLIEKSKTFVSGVTTWTSGAYGNGQKAIAIPNTVPGSYDSLGQTDVLGIKAIYMSPSLATAATTNHTNITSRYILDNGQRENFYDVARIQLAPGAASPTGQLLVIYDYFTHNPGDYFCVNSYATVDYSLIPAFNSIRGAISLRDAIDFRPTKSNDGTGFIGTGASTTNTIVPNSTILTDIQYYLPRIDKIFVTKFGEFGTVSGISSTDPRPPQDPEDSMVLYTLGLGAYTFGPGDVIAKMVENKRYTMRDIGRLEKRISNVEYYTSLSLLEKDTASTQIFDTAGNQRYKNGFIVDSFVDHSIGAVSHPDYKCSIEAETGTLRPDYSQKYINLVPNIAASTGIVQTGPLVTLAYTEVTAIEQPYSSYSDPVNPHAVYRWKGNLQVSPTGDDWKDVFYKPDISPAATPEYASWYGEAQEEDSSQLLFNSWQITWFGASPEEEEALKDIPAGNINFIQPGGWSFGDYLNAASVTGIGTTSTVRATIPGVWGGIAGGTFEGIATRVGKESRSPVRSGIFNSTQTTQVSDAVVDTTLVPYIRSRKIYFKATGLKPNSRVYPFFDGIDVSSYVREEANFVDYTSNPDDTSYADRTGHPAGSTALIADSSGEVIGSFVIPLNSTTKFSTGDRIFRLIDNQNNDTNSAFTYAEFKYTAKGLIETRQRTIVSVAEPTVVSTPVPGPAPLVQPSVSISVQGRTPKYIGTAFNFDVSTFATGFGTLQGLTVWERSGASESSLGFWSQGLISYQSGTTSGTYSANSVWRLTPSQWSGGGAYQVQARAVWNGNTYLATSGVFNFAALPANLVGQPVDDRFYN